ncbi:MAG: pentapeptide repeat-containing protein, partial [Flavobacteriaceae bacterium]|nr:pentapeptide repeat-containing protein [Flavobacteriaceae bacterium]
LADISKLKFDNCNCKDAIFNQTIMEQTDFRTSYNFTIHPEKNNINKAKFTKENVSGLLASYNILIE